VRLPTDNLQRFSGNAQLTIYTRTHISTPRASNTQGEPKAIPWNHIGPIRAAVDGWAHQDIRPGSVVAWPTNLGWMMGPWLVYAALLNGGTIALYQVRVRVCSRSVLLSACPSCDPCYTTTSASTSP